MYIDHMVWLVYAMSVYVWITRVSGHVNCLNELPLNVLPPSWDCGTDCWWVLTACGPNKSKLSIDGRGKQVLMDNIWWCVIDWRKANPLTKQRRKNMKSNKPGLDHRINFDVLATANRLLAAHLFRLHDDDDDNRRQHHHHQYYRHRRGNYDNHINVSAA